MDSDKVMYVCIALICIVGVVCLAQCAPLMDQAHVDRIAACVAGGGTYLDGACINMCGGD